MSVKTPHKVKLIVPCDYTTEVIETLTPGKTLAQIRSVNYGSLGVISRDSIKTLQTNVFSTFGVRISRDSA